MVCAAEHARPQANSLLLHALLFELFKAVLQQLLHPRGPRSLHLCQTRTQSHRSRPLFHRRLAKAKRERLRNATMVPDYIPVAGGGLGPGRLNKMGDYKHVEEGLGSGSEEEIEETVRVTFGAGKQCSAISDRAPFNVPPMLLLL